MDVRPLCHSNLQTRQLLFNEVVLPFFLLHFCDESCSLFGELLHVVYVILKQCVCGIKERRKKKNENDKIQSQTWRLHNYVFIVTFSRKAIVFSRLDTCLDRQLSRSLSFRYCKETKMRRAQWHL